MKGRIRIERVEEGRQRTQRALVESVPRGFEERFQPWMKAFRMHWEQMGRGELWGDEELVGMVAKIEADHGEEGALEAAARWCVGAGGAEGRSERAQARIVAALWYLKAMGREPGRASTQHYRINRLLNGGAQALDSLLAASKTRSVVLRALVFRVVSSAMARAEVKEGAISAEVPLAVGWDEAQDAVLRRRRPEAVPPGAEEVLDWIWAELLSRGLLSVTLGSVIEEGRSGRIYAPGEEAQAKLKGLPGDEGRFLAGALFLPALVGGFPATEEERILNAFAMAREVSEGFVPAEQKVEAYREHLAWVRGQRRLLRKSASKESALPGIGDRWEIRDGSGILGGRWGLRVHPLRRKFNDSRGFFVVEGGLFLEASAASRSWSGMQKRQILRRLQAIADEQDDAAFEEFAALLDETVEWVNRAPAALLRGLKLSEEPLLQGSPFWSELGRGLEEIGAAVGRGDALEVANQLRRWTVALTAGGEQNKF